MGFALESAIPIITADQIERLRARSEAFFYAEPPEEATNRIYEFDHVLSGFSGNTLLPLIICSFRAPIKELWRRYLARCGSEGLYRRNEGLLAFIAKKDADAAKRLINESVNATIRGGAEAAGPFRRRRAGWAALTVRLFLDIIT